MAKKRRYTLEEYSALKTAYGEPYSRADLFASLFKPFVFIFAYTYFVGYIWWLSVIYGLLASLYQYRRINKLNMSREYQEKAFNERNKFLNNITQILTNPNTTTLDGLMKSANRTSGEFQDDLGYLLTELKDSDPRRVHSAFETFKVKYETDVVFIQYIDQLETAILDGRNNVEVLKDIRTFHNNVKKKRDFFIRLKSKRTSQFKQIVLILLASILAMAFSLGFSKYINEYAHTMYGWVGNNLYLLVIFMIFRGHLKKQEDDNVMEVSM